MNIFSKAKWIWNENSLNKVDDYVSFKQEFKSNKDTATLLISCDSIYALYVNGNLIKFMQCSDFPYAKYYDEIELKDLKEINELRIDVWHLGVETQNYYASNAGVIFELKQEDNVIIYSSDTTQSRVISQFKNGQTKFITSQLGLSFSYDSTIKDNSYSSSVVVDKMYEFSKREINDLILSSRQNIKITNKENSIIIDLGKETAGIIDLDFVSNKKQTLLITYGEHIKDNGSVRRIIGARDFSFTYVAKEGHNQFINPLRRIAGRYIEVFFEEAISINYIGIRATNYDHEIIKKVFSDKLVQEIYDKCVYTIECCMHEHYEDCPWREQCLYSLDSRNQMLCGYYAFKGFEYQKHNLLLMAKDPMYLGLLSLCYPTNSKSLGIPMFSLTYIIQVYEYIEYTKDIEILKQVEPVIDKIVSFFLKEVKKNGLIKYLPKPYWNFYEWTLDSDGSEVFDVNSNIENQYDLIINCMFIYAMNLFKKYKEYDADFEGIKPEIVTRLYDEDKHLFRINSNSNNYSQFGNAMAILVGLGDEITLKKVKECDGLVEASLSVRGFVYDALLTNEENKSFVIDDIKYRYKKMIDDGATTFYEVEEGSEAFGQAGSLCHGWSALPIYYFNELLDK